MSTKSNLMGLLLASAVATQTTYAGDSFAGPQRVRRKHRLEDDEYGTNRATLSPESEQAIKEARVQAEQQRQAKNEAKRARREAQRSQHVKS